MIVGRTWNDLALFRTALRHKSWCNENAGHESYERLEFLGDKVLDMLVAEHLFRKHPLATEHEMSVMCANAVNAHALAHCAMALGLVDLIMIGGREKRQHDRFNVKIQSDVMEAVIGAAHMDGGLGAAWAVVRHAGIL